MDSDRRLSTLDRLDKFEVGEADALAEKAYLLMGGYKVKAQKVKSKRATTDSLDRWLKKDQSS